MQIVKREFEKVKLINVQDMVKELVTNKAKEKYKDISDVFTQVGVQVSLNSDYRLALRFFPKWAEVYKEAGKTSKMLTDIDCDLLIVLDRETTQKLINFIKERVR